ncbi:MAG: rhodanese-like domain-containing protein, partial [Desulfobacteraceae bacterium]|nr:rhodanese-like domain-containing protein [Desulfobacteraceae bacterium]
MAERGYTSVYAFIGGIPEWRRFNYSMTINKEWQKIRVKKLSPGKLLNLMKKEDIYILDTRPMNFKRDNTFIKGSTLCPLVYLIDRYPELPEKRKIVITDWAMKQSPTAAKFLMEKGYTIAGVLKGGLERWKADGFPVEKRE